MALWPNSNADKGKKREGNKRAVLQFSTYARPTQILVKIYLYRIQLVYGHAKNAL